MFGTGPWDCLYLIFVNNRCLVLVITTQISPVTNCFSVQFLDRTHPFVDSHLSRNYVDASPQYRNILEICRIVHLFSCELFASISKSHNAPQGGARVMGDGRGTAGSWELRAVYGAAGMRRGPMPAALRRRVCTRKAGAGAARDSGRELSLHGADRARCQPRPGARRPSLSPSDAAPYPPVGRLSTSCSRPPSSTATVRGGG
jgi:hypothetical protein